MISIKMLYTVNLDLFTLNYFVNKHYHANLILLNTKLYFDSFIILRYESLTSIQIWLKFLIQNTFSF